MIQKWREKIQERIEDLQEKAKNFWQGLAPREQTIVMILGGFISLLLVALMIRTADEIFFQSSYQAERNLQNVDRIQKLARELVHQKEDLNRYQKLKEKRGEKFDLTQFLQQESTKFGLNLEKVSPTRPRLAAGSKEPKESKEEWVEVQIGKGLALDPVLRFLKSVEETLGVRIVELNIKPEFTDPTKLEVTTVIASSKEL